MTDLKFIEAAVDAQAERILDANDRIWEYAEPPFKEMQSSALLGRLLKEAGFTVETGLAGIPTCFTGTFVFGTGKPVMGILGEYDALPGLSQEAALPVKKEREAGGFGHGCGHCVLGAASLAAAIAVKNYLEEFKKDGTIIYFGCPAEEGAGSKQFMTRAGLFDNVDFVYTWHPSTVNRVDPSSSNAIMGADFSFRGITAHAGSSPHLGRSALGGAELMNIGWNYLREVIIPEARLHSAYSDVGGSATNVIQDHATLSWEVRAPRISQVREILERVINVAKGAAMMTGTSMEYRLVLAFTEYVPNLALAAVADECLREVGAPEWSDGDYRLAKEFLSTYTDDTREMIREKIAALYGADRLEEILEKPLDSEVHPFDASKIQQDTSSTDVGDVGYAVPTLILGVATSCVGNVGHTWQMTAQSCSSIAHKGLLTAAKVMALAAVRTRERPDGIAAAKDEVTRRNGGRYTCPLPDYVSPPVNTD